LSYLHGDYLQSTVSASNGATTEYTRYGLVRTSTGTLPTDRQFQGQQKQAGTGLYRMGVRWYDPVIGRWTQWHGCRVARPSTSPLSSGTEVASSSYLVAVASAPCPRRVRLRNGGSGARSQLPRWRVQCTRSSHPSPTG
ncbi:MAG: hypothetical protein HYY04_12410, partial [Chloroflexi bacterium]|nr:hypothetical protein [Chloroflexota bacterium]